MLLSNIFTLLLLGTSTSVMNVLADTIGLTAPKDVVDFTKNVNLLTTVPDPINCATTKDANEKKACNDWEGPVKAHVLVGTPATCSGAHLMSIWSKEQGSTYPKTVKAKTGIAGGKSMFKFGSKGLLCSDAKFVWNDVGLLSPNIAPYTQDDVSNICLKAFFYARKAGQNPETKNFKVDTGRPHPNTKITDTLAICVTARYDHATPSSCYPATSAPFLGADKGKTCQ